MKHDTNKAIQKNRQRLIAIAKEKGYIFNSDDSWIDQILNLMNDSYQEHGKYLCPCKQSFPPDPDNDTCCPCSALDAEVVQDGYCHCRLFFAKGVQKSRVNILETISCPG